MPLGSATADAPLHSFWVLPEGLPREAGAAWDTPHAAGNPFSFCSRARCLRTGWRKETPRNDDGAPMCIGKDGKTLVCGRSVGEKVCAALHDGSTPAPCDSCKRGAFASPELVFHSIEHGVEGRRAGLKGVPVAELERACKALGLRHSGMSKAAMVNLLEQYYRASKTGLYECQGHAEPLAVTAGAWGRGGARSAAIAAASPPLPAAWLRRGPLGATEPPPPMPPLQLTHAQSPWTCTRCALNTNTGALCVACGASGLLWTCAQCTTLNASGVLACATCALPHPTATAMHLLVKHAMRFHVPTLSVLAGAKAAGEAGMLEEALAKEAAQAEEGSMGGGGGAVLSLDALAAAAAAVPADLEAKANARVTSLPLCVPGSAGKGGSSSGSSGDGSGSSNPSADPTPALFYAPGLYEAFSSLSDFKGRRDRQGGSALHAVAALGLSESYSALVRLARLSPWAGRGSEGVTAVALLEGLALPGGGGGGAARLHSLLRRRRIVPPGLAAAAIASWCGGGGGGDGESVRTPPAHSAALAGAAAALAAGELDKVLQLCSALIAASAEDAEAARAARPLQACAMLQDTYGAKSARVHLEAYCALTTAAASGPSAPAPAVDPLYFLALYWCWWLDERREAVGAVEGEARKAAALDALAVFCLHEGDAVREVREALVTRVLLKAASEHVAANARAAAAEAEADAGEDDPDQEEDVSEAPPGPGSPEWEWRVAKGAAFGVASAAMDELMALTGMRKVKELAMVALKEVLLQKQGTRPKGLQAETRLNFTFEGNPGTGSLAGRMWRRSCSARAHAWHFLALRSERLPIPDPYSPPPPPYAHTPLQARPQWQRCSPK